MFASVSSETDFQLCFSSFTELRMFTFFSLFLLWLLSIIIEQMGLFLWHAIVTSLLDSLVTLSSTKLSSSSYSCPKTIISLNQHSQYPSNTNSMPTNYLYHIVFAVELTQ